MPLQFFDTVRYNPQTIPTANKAQALKNLGDAPLYLGVNHLLNFQRLVFWASADGRIPRRIGNVTPFPAPAGGSLRDPKIIYYPPTDEFVMAYTPNAFGAGDELGFLKTKNFRSVTDLGVVSMPGTGITPITTWVGGFIVEGGEYYITFLPSAGTWDNPGVMWSRCLNPGTWTSWTNATRFISTNPNLTSGGATELNDVKIFKVGATYHLFCDADSAGPGTHRLMHATSSSFLTGYSVLTPLFTPAVEIEGCIPVLLPDGSWRFYYQPITSNLSYIEANAALTVFGTETLVPWSDVDGIGNGDVIPIYDLGLKQRIMDAIGAVPDVATLTVKRQGAGTNQEFFMRDQAGNYVGSLGVEGLATNDLLLGSSAAMRFCPNSTIARGATPNVERMRLSNAGLTLFGIPLITPTATPASATAAGTAGEWAWDANFIYVCVATNTWKRSAIATWP